MQIVFVLHDIYHDIAEFVLDMNRDQIRAWFHMCHETAILENPLL